MSIESGKFYAGRNEAGYGYIEKRPEEKELYQEWVENFLAWSKEKLKYIAENVTETWHQIEANELPEERAVELRRALVYALGLSATIMSPNKQEIAQAYGDTAYEQTIDSDTPESTRIDLTEIPAVAFQERTQEQTFEDQEENAFSEEVGHYFEWLQTDANNHFVQAMENADRKSVV